MSLSIGIVGLPNVGKSTMFNALTKTVSAECTNFPFATIDPNVGIVELPDKRVDRIAEIVKPEKILRAPVKFVDIAGIVKGASEGEGLGNKFLSNIREVDAIVQVVRVFADDNVTHVAGVVDPKADIDVIATELMLADLDVLEKTFDRAAKLARSGGKEDVLAFSVIERLVEALRTGKACRDVELDDDEKKSVKSYGLLTLKPLFYVANIGEGDVGKDVDYNEVLGLDASVGVVPISAQIEAEFVELSDEEASVFLEDLGLKESGLNALIRVGFESLGLATYFTAGVTEVRAWVFHKGWLAPQCAGVIHNDFERGYISADVVSCDDFVECGGWSGAKDSGKVSQEGKGYEFKDGDVTLFKFNV
jgi:GTP-binding protein YchF